MPSLLLTILCVASIAGAPVIEADEVVTPPDATTPAPTDIPPQVSWLRVEINIPARELSLIDHDQVVAQYPVAIGQLAYQSIEMSDQISTIEWNPWWYPPPSPWAAGASVAPPGLGNPLGPVKLPLGQGIRIHGTNKDSSVGRAASHGCFRMHDKDAVALAWYLQSRLSEKTDPSWLEKYTKNRRTTFVVALTQRVPIDIRYQPVIVRGDVLYLYQDVYGRVRNWHQRVMETLTQHGIDATTLSPERVGELRKQLSKGKVEITVQDLFRPAEPEPLMSKVDIAAPLY